MVKIDLPDQIKKNQEDLYNRKSQEARDALDKFLKENEITIKPIIRPTIDGIFPDIAVIPNEFLKSKSTSIENA